MGAELKFDMNQFNGLLAETRQMLHRNSGSYVRTTARRLVRRLAYNTPITKAKRRNRGRLRAGFWPAAAALGITNIYTRFPNKNEGSAVDNTRDMTNPRFTITNSVPYIQNLRMGYNWVDEARRGVQAQMAKDLEKYVQQSWARRALVDDLTAE